MEFSNEILMEFIESSIKMSLTHQIPDDEKEFSFIRLKFHQFRIILTLELSLFFQHRSVLFVTVKSFCGG